MAGGAPSRRIRTPIAYQETSREAWQTLRPIKGKIDKLIVAAYLQHGALSDEQVERLTGLKHQTVSGNRRHLVEDRIVMESGEWDYTSPRRPKIKWTLTPDGRTHVAHILSA